MERCHWSKWLCCLHTLKMYLLYTLDNNKKLFKFVSQIENFTACLRGMNIFVFGKFPYSTGCTYSTLSLLYMTFYAVKQTGLMLRNKPIILYLTKKLLQYRKCTWIFKYRVINIDFNIDQYWFELVLSSLGIGYFVGFCTIIQLYNQINSKFYQKRKPMGNFQNLKYIIDSKNSISSKTKHRSKELFRSQINQFEEHTTIE